jgi:hypothetical protein
MQLHVYLSPYMGEGGGGGRGWHDGNPTYVEGGTLVAVKEKEEGDVGECR